MSTQAHYETTISRLRADYRSRIDVVSTFIRARPRRFILLLAGLLAAVIGAGLQHVATAQTIPTISIVEVNPDTSVTLMTANFPANQTFTARMGPFGTRGVDGIVVGTTDSGAGGMFQVSFPIPEALQGAPRIAVRLDSPAGYYSYSWFDNRASVQPVPTVAPTATPGVTPATAVPAAPVSEPGGTVPSFDIVGVIRDQQVTIETADFPAGQLFTATMGPMGSRGIGGTIVATTSSGDGGTFRVTYPIPESQQGSAIIAIRLESPSGYYSYNWFYNSTSP